VSYSALTIGLLGLRVGALIGVDALAGQAHELDRLRAAGVDVRLATLERGPVFDNLERPEGRVQVAHSISDAVEPGELQRTWAGAPAWVLTPVAAELPDAWADVPSREAIVAVAWQGMLRDLRVGEPVGRTDPRASRLLERAELVGVSRDDLAPDAELADLCRFLRPGATLVVTAGTGGGLVAEAGPDGPRRLFRYPAVAPDRRVDPTGAGDVFLAALLAARVRPQLVGGRLGQRHDVLLAAAVASLVVEAAGLDGVPDRDRIRRRVAQAGARKVGRVG
jgi:sugar/nucleoside kinase (ribokinase family)